MLNIIFCMLFLFSCSTQKVNPESSYIQFLNNKEAWLVTFVPPQSLTEQTYIYSHGVKNEIIQLKIINAKKMKVTTSPIKKKNKILKDMMLVFMDHKSLAEASGGRLRVVDNDSFRIVYFDSNQIAKVTYSKPNKWTSSINVTFFNRKENLDIQQSQFKKL